MLVLRDKTEQPEAIDEGVVKLVGSNYGRIVQETQHLLDDKEPLCLMSFGGSVLNVVLYSLPEQQAVYA